MIQEKERRTASGLLMLTIFLIVLVVAALGAFRAVRVADLLGLAAFVLVAVVDLFLTTGLFTVAPNQGVVLQLFGDYRGTARDEGLRWANPFYSKRQISLRVRNFESGSSRSTTTTATPSRSRRWWSGRWWTPPRRCFEVDDYEHYVKVQSEAAVRNLATRYPYDTHEEGEMSLRGNIDEVAQDLKEQIQERLDKAGVEVIEARISHLAYAPEIASAMLRRQQAGAIIAARAKIVEGAVGMVEMALEQLSRSDQVQLDEERKAPMVSNLLVVLCGDKDTQPVVNTGTLHQ